MKNLAGLALVFALVLGLVLVVANLDDPAESQARREDVAAPASPKGVSMIAPKIALTELAANDTDLLSAGRVADGLGGRGANSGDSVVDGTKAQEPTVENSAGSQTGPNPSGPGDGPARNNSVPLTPTAPGDSDLEFVTFKQVSSFKYVEPDPGKPETLKKNQVPEAVQALGRKRIAMEGYLVPLDSEPDGRHAKTFFLMPNTMACCFGQLPEINEVVELRFEKPQKIVKDVLIKATGVFEVGEQFDEYGYLMSLYRIQGESLEDPWNQ